MLEIKPLQSSMHVLVTSNFDNDSIKNEQASIETSLSSLKSMGYYSGNLRQITRLWPKSELIQDFMHVIVTCKFKKDLVNNKKEQELCVHETLCPRHNDFP